MFTDVVAKLTASSMYHAGPAFWGSRGGGPGGGFGHSTVVILSYLLCLRYFLGLQVLGKGTPPEILPSPLLGRYAVPCSFRIRYQQLFCMCVIVNIPFYCILFSYLFDKYRGSFLSCRPILTDWPRVWFLRITRTALVPKMQ